MLIGVTDGFGVAGNGLSVFLVGVVGFVLVVDLRLTIAGLTML